MKKWMIPVTLTVAAALASASSRAAIVTLDFEGLKNSETVLNYYNGGTGGSGSGPGANYGVSFSSNALALIDSDAGGTGNFGGEPSPDTVLFFLSGTAATLNYASGFDTGFSFYYSATNNPGVVRVYDGLNATGTLLTTLNLPVTPTSGAPDPTGSFSPLVPLGVAFAGTARSVDFGGVGNQIAFDNITFGSETPTVVPEPTTLALLASSGLLALRRRRK